MAVTAVVGEAISLHQLHQLHQLGGDRERGGQIVRTRRTTCPGCPDRLSGLCNVLKWNTCVPKWNTESQKRPQNWSLAGGRMEDHLNQEKIRRSDVQRVARSSVLPAPLGGGGGG